MPWMMTRSRWSSAPGPGADESSILGAGAADDRARAPRRRKTLLRDHQKELEPYANVIWETGSNVLGLRAEFSYRWNNPPWTSM
jgi:hypothetical protein